MELRRAAPGDAVTCASKKDYAFPGFVFALLITNGVFNFTPVTEVFIATAIAAAVVAFAMTLKYRKNAALTDAVSAASFCWCFLVCISSIWAVNRSGAFISTVGYSGAFLLFFAVRAYTSEKTDKRKVLARSVGYAGAVISLLSIEMASTGILEILYFGPLSGFFGIAEQTTRFGLWVEGCRMQSLMGLPNIYASFAAMCFFLSLWLVAGEHVKKAGMLDIAAVVMNGVGFFLTGSRGGLLAMCAAAAVYIIYCAAHERRRLTADCFMLLIWCAVTYLALVGTMGTGSPVVWLILLVSINLLSGLRPVILKAFEGRNTVKTLPVFVAAGCAAAGLVCFVLRIRGLSSGILPAENITQRLIYWRDGMRLFAQSPLIGLGGGAFETLAGSVADTHYVTRHVHNHYIQALVENGVIGLFIMLASCFIALFSLWGRRAELERGFAPCLAAAASMMLFHSVVEASLHNLLNLIVFLMLLGLISGACPKKRRIVLGEAFKTVVCLCAALSAALLGGRLITQYYVSAAEAEGTARALAAYRLAVVTDPLNASAYKTACLTRYAADSDSGAASLSARFAGELERNLNTPRDCFSVARYYLRMGDSAKAVRYFERYIELCRVNPSAWNEVLAQYYRALQSRGSQDSDYVTPIADSSVRLRRFLDGLNESLPVPVMPDAVLLWGTAQY